MNQAQILREKFDNDLKELQDNCIHIKTKEMPQMWAPGHYSDNKVIVCEECDKIVGTGGPFYSLQLAFGI
jgi:hypothetical protein